MRAEILCIGTELLIGQTVNTNATFLARELAAVGIDLLWVTTIGDNLGRMVEAIATAMARADVVLLSGGLGPTADDLTVEGIARYLGEPLEERPDVRAHIEAIFRKRNRPLAASNYKQALFPASVDTIPNPAGTACGVYLERNGHVLMAFPGVPVELHEMWKHWARPRLAARAGAIIQSTLLRYVGIGEAALAERVAHLLEGHNPTVAPYAGDWEVHLRVTAKAATALEAEALMAPVIRELEAITPYYYGRDLENLPAAVGRLLASREERVATAESCTGGLLASRLTDVSGSSNYTIGGVVAYDVRIKKDVLGVSDAALAHGVVSEAVAREMAQGARRVLGAQWGVGITGYAGGGEGVPEGDAGLVWYAVAGPDGQEAAESSRFGEGTPRETAKFRATQTALALLRGQLLR